MALFCIHDDKAHVVLAGTKYHRVVDYAILFYCRKCIRERLDKGYSEKRAYEKLKWLQEHGR